jgi:hypothetical protein
MTSFRIALLAGLALPLVSIGGAINIGSSSGLLTFAPGPPETLTFPNPAGTPVIMGAGSDGPVTISWSLTLSSPSLTLSGGLITPSLGETLAFSLGDTVGDMVRGSVLFNSNTTYGPDATVPTDTDLDFQIQINAVHDTGLFDSFIGGPLTTNEILNVDLVVQCASSVCIQSNDPTGTVIGAALTTNSSITATPEPATMGLFGIGILGLAIVHRKTAWLPIRN